MRNIAILLCFITSIYVTNLISSFKSTYESYIISLPFHNLSYAKHLKPSYSFWHFDLLLHFGYAR